MPIQLPYEGTPLMLAASLGNREAQGRLPPGVLGQLDNAFDILLSCCDFNNVRERFPPPRLWPYTLNSAMRMAIAVYREFLPDWNQCFENSREDIPKHIPRSFALDVCSMVSQWICDPKCFSWDDAAEKYGWIKQDICLDGHLTNEFPKTPTVVSCHCYSALYLVSVEPQSGPTLRDYDPNGRYAAWMSEVIGSFVMEGINVDRMRQAVIRELIPWCLGKGDPCDA